MNRLEFLATGLAGAASVGLISSGQAQEKKMRSPPESSGFKLKYAPHFGMFKHHAGDDPVEQLEFAAGQGFTAWEDNGNLVSLGVSTGHPDLGIPVATINSGLGPVAIEATSFGSLKSLFR